MLSDGNKFLIVQKGVVLNDALDEVIAGLDKPFEDANHIAYVTSGIRTAEDQLRIIKGYISRKNIEDEFIGDATVDKKVVWEGKEIYSWQLSWGKLLNHGVIINPPLRAELLLDYVNKAGKNRKGDYFNPSVHFLGKAFDIGGGANSVEDEKQIVVGAIKSGNCLAIKDFVVERENNCLHIDIV